MKYVSLLRGINVGGNNKLSMAELKVCFEKAGLLDVKTYINSGNVIFSSNETDEIALAKSIEQLIKNQFAMNIPTLVISRDRYKKMVDNIPKGWGEDQEWKYNVLFLLPPYSMDEVIASIGILKPDIETLIPGDGLLYQSMSRELFGKTTTGKLASSPAYKRMTIRNLNTTKKLLTLVDTDG